MTQNSKPQLPQRPAQPVKQSAPPPQRAPIIPAEEIDHPLNSMLLTKSKPLAMVEGQHPFLSRIRAAKKHSEFISGLFMGPSGAGKSSILGSAGFDKRTGPILVLSADLSMKALHGIPEEVCTVVPIETWEDLTEAWDYLRYQKHPFRSVALDGMTDLHIYSILTIMEAKMDTAKHERDPLTTEQADYGNSMAQIRKIVILFKRLNMHVFFTSQPKTMSIPKMGTCQVPSLFGQMALEIAGSFDFCVYVSTSPMHDTTKTPTRSPVKSQAGEDVTRFVYLQNTPQLIIKVRNDWGKSCPDFVQINREGAMTTILDAMGV